MSERCIAAFPEYVRELGKKRPDRDALLAQWSAALLPFDPRITGQDSIRRFQGVVSAEFLKQLLPVLQKSLGLAAVQLLQTQGNKLLLPLPAGAGTLSGLQFLPEGVEDETSTQENWITIEVGADTASLRSRLTALISEYPGQMRALLTAGSAPLLSTQEGKQLLQVLHTPLGVARIQKVVLENLLSGQLSLAAQEWDITVIERDIPCAALAVEDLTRLLDRLFILEGAGRRLPAINLKVYCTADFADSPLHAVSGCRPTVLASGQAIAPCTLVLDVSMLHTADIPDEEIPLPDAPSIRIRSVMSGKEREKFRSASAVVYKGAGRGASADFEITAEAEAALRGLQDDVFGCSAFRQGQLEFLSRMLRAEQVIAAMPPAAGKTMPVLLASVLQSAPTVIVAPSSDMLTDTAAALDEAGIDAYVLLREEARREERLAALGALSKGNALIGLIPANLFDSEDVRNALMDARREGVVFARAVIDEAQSCSEWSHDARYAMQHIAGRICAAATTAPFRHVPLAMLTASMSPRVHSHLLRQLATAQQHARAEGAWLLLLPGALPPDVRLVPVVTSSTGSQEQATEIRQLLEALPKALQAGASDNSTETPSSDNGLDQLFSTHGEGAAVVFVPAAANVSARYGAERQGLAEILDASPFRTARYTGQDCEGVHVGRQILRDAAGERKRFSRGEANLLVSTRAWGIGSHRPGVRATIHVQPSPSIARLLQECGRAGHDGGPALCYVCIPKSVLKRNAAESRKREESALHHGFSTSAREKQILSDLLKEITYPEDTNTSRIANLLSDEFGTGILTAYWQRNLDERLYLQTRRGEVLGYIDLVALTVVRDTNYSDQTFAREALEFAFRQSIAEAGSGPSLSAWVSATFPSDADDGILRQMKDFDIGASFTLRIGFENDKEPILTQIHSLLWRRAEIEIQRKILSEISADTWESFVAQIEDRTQQQGVFSRLDQDLGLALRQMFLKIRSRADTERAILRMMALGAVTDVVANPASRRFALTINVRRDAEYREALQHYVRMLMPEKDAERVLQVLPTYTGDSVLEQCLFFLIDHLYRWIGEYHDREATDLDVLLHTVMREDGPQRFHTTAVHTSTSRYARPDELPRVLTLEGQEQLRELLLIAEGLEADGPGGVLEHVRHLRRSCEILSPFHAHSALLEALAALADTVDPPDDETEKSAPSRFAEAVLFCLALSRGKQKDCDASLHRLGVILRRHLSEECISAIERKVRDGLPDLERLRSEREELIRKAEDSLPPVTSAPSVASGRSALPAQAPVADFEAKGAATETAQGTVTPPRPAKPSQAPEAQTPEVQAPAEPPAPGRAAAPESLQPAAVDIDSFARLLNVRTAESSGESAKPEATPTPSGPKEKSVTPGAPQQDPQPIEPPSKADRNAQVEVRGVTPQPRVQQKSSTPAPERAPKPQAAPITPDPELVSHLQWLRTFNNSFLKGYEAGND
ncbi:MAG: hypothetical protein M5R41_19505 [Bacteroidia bacterium]|nr:hypothetical protein [Bacteroidia bacterium]